MLLSTAYEQQGNLPAALDGLQKASQLETEIPFPLAELGHLYGKTGRRSDAEKILTQLTDPNAKIYIPPYNLMEVYLGLGEKDQALAALEKAYADRSIFLPFADADPEFESLHSDPRYNAVMNKVRPHW